MPASLAIASPSRSHATDARCLKPCRMGGGPSRKRRVAEEEPIVSPKLEAHLSGLEKLCVDEAQIANLGLTNDQLQYLVDRFPTLFPGLCSLDLYQNQLTTLTSSLTASNLTHLTLNDNYLPQLPAHLASLTALRELYLGANRITALDPAVLRSLTQLRRLYLNQNRLTDLPAEIGALSLLQELFVDGNRLTSLPREIGHLGSLMQLDARENELYRLPPEIAMLTNLEQLFLSDNKLHTLPDDFGGLISLWELDLQRNNLAFLPFSVMRLTNMRHVVVRHQVVADPRPPKIPRRPMRGPLPLAVLAGNAVLNHVDDDKVAAFNMPQDLRDRLATAHTCDCCDLRFLEERIQVPQETPGFSIQLLYTYRPEDYWAVNYVEETASLGTVSTGSRRSRHSRSSRKSSSSSKRRRRQVDASSLPASSASATAPDAAAAATAAPTGS